MGEKIDEDDNANYDGEEGEDENNDDFKDDEKDDDDEDDRDPASVIPKSECVLRPDLDVEDVFDYDKDEKDGNNDQTSAWSMM